MLRLYFDLRKIGRISTKIHILHQIIIIFLTLTTIEVVKKKPYLLQNPGSEIPQTLWVRGPIIKSKPKILYWRLLFKTRPICFLSWYFVIFTLKPLQLLIIDINTANITQFFGPNNYVYRDIR